MINRKLETRLAEIAVNLGLAAKVEYRERAGWDYEWRVKRKAELEAEERQRKLESERVERNGAKSWSRPGLIAC